MWENQINATSGTTRKKSNFAFLRNELRVIHGISFLL